MQVCDCQNWMYEPACLGYKICIIFAFRRNCFANMNVVVCDII